ncbi:Rieske 2Fe-2S domain-containing protein [Mycolicibacterium flavescens]|uniref:cholesterol 7-desaturase n=1 Tax=Mycolicibacterium flavescens TaxID=1776 RepID=A0A1E3RLR9_MYCFV|nr:Rieske 2Fe-2S domain-containing protein [Mycolicibacterium flavescens]ODQ90835.1 (2Fe-2S)-binding protein [Mycolicibacterium flavescens]
MTQTHPEPAVDPSDREFGSGITLSTYRFPTGWFIVGFDSDVAPGDVKRLHYFGEELVLFRTRSGRLQVLDAYCQHLGANMAVGGTVEDEHLVCPWHGWHWNGDGANVLIPYSKIGCKQNVRVRAYPCMQWYGFILVWHERHGRPPYWHPPAIPELETDEYYPLHPHSRMVNRVKVHAQMIIENAADPYHVQYVHKADRAAHTADFEVNGYRLHATVNANFGGGRPKTWLTPNGPVDAKIIYDNFSLGLGFVRFPSELLATVQVTGQTPVDEDYTDYFYTQASIREPGDTGDVPSGRAARFIQLQQEVIKQDFFTWENMKYLEKPNLAPEEARDYAALRRWAHRFYPGAEPRPDDFGYTEGPENGV